MKTRTFFVLLLSIMSCSCTELFVDNPYTLEMRDNSSNLFRIDGYYYRDFDDSLISVRIFYSDGIVIDNLRWESLPEIENKIISGSFYKDIKSQKNCWGLYTVDSTAITVETFVNIPLKYTPKKEFGKIINDTTIDFESKFSNQGTVRYLFKPICPKPDSSNVFTPKE